MRFRNAAARGCNLSAVSSWKLESSTTTSPSQRRGRGADGARERRAEVAADEGGRPVCSAISPASAVTVDLPLVPVTPTIGACDEAAASSISPVTAHAASLRADLSGRVGHAGRDDDQVRLEEGPGSWPPSCQRDARAELLARASAVRRRCAESVTVTRGAARWQKRATARPVLPRADDEHACVGGRTPATMS